MRPVGRAGSQNVILTPGCTYSLNFVLKGLLRPGDRVRVQRADGETLELELVGRAVRYPTHQEAAAREKRLI